LYRDVGSHAGRLVLAKWNF